jgi:predicted transposase/invertase (TIGR01784 family)
MALDKPHDKFFKDTFSNTDIVTDETYLDDALNEYYVDLLFTANFGTKPIRLALLFEHKSYTEEHPHFQLNQYLLNFWTRQLDEKKPLIPVVPVVIYHGDRPWQQRPPSAYFDELPNELIAYVPAFEYILINLQQVVQNGLTLLRSDYARLTALLLQHSRNQRRLLRVFEEFAHLFAALAQEQSGRAFIEKSFLYVYWTTDLTKQQVVAIFHKISRQTGEAAMTTAERLINEGIEKGLERGLEKGLERGIEKGVRAMLKLGMKAPDIAAALEVPLPMVRTIIRQLQAENR